MTRDRYGEPVDTEPLADVIPVRTSTPETGRRWIESIKAALTCPKCSGHRVLVGPSYDRPDRRCLDCGHTWRAEP